MRKYITLIVWCLCHSILLAQQSDEMLAAHYYDNGQMAEAAQIYESLYSKTRNTYYYRRLYNSYINLSQYKDAAKLIEKHRKYNPKDLYLLVDEGNLYLLQKQEKKAKKIFGKAIESITSNLQPIPDLAQAFANIEQNEYCIKTYKTARERTKNKYLYFNELLTVYQQMGDYESMTNEYFDLLDNQPSMMGNIQLSMQHALKEASSHELSDGIRKALIQRVREHPDNKSYTEMMIWFSLQENDFRFALDQAYAVDARFPEIGSEQVMRVAKIAQNNQAFDISTEAYQFLQRKGTDNPYYIDAKIGELEIAFIKNEKEYSLSPEKVKLLQSQYLSAFDELGKNDRTIPLMRNYAKLMGQHTNNIQEAVSILDDILEIPRISPKTRDEVKLELGDMLLFAGEIWDASLLYMQVEKANKDDVLGSAAKFRNAKLSYYTHDFSWANSQLKVLRSSTSKLIANDAMELSLLISDNMEDDSTFTMLSLFADADLLLYQSLLDSAWACFDNITKQNLSHPLFDEILLKKAQIRIKQKRYADADSLLQQLIEFYPYDITADDALNLRAELNEGPLSNRQIALECYEKILLDYPTSLYADHARKRYNILRTK